jgi:5-methylcytosine-specific restriction endonuclease McrA
MKKCSTCKELKTLDNFHNRKDFIDGKATICKSCKKESDKRYREKNREYLCAYKKEQRLINPMVRIQQRKSHEKTRFGFNATEYVQDKKCVSCGISNEEHLMRYKERLHIDHVNNDGRKNQRMGLKPNNSFENLQVLCRSCHVSKDNRLKNYIGRKVIDNSTGVIYSSIDQAARELKLSNIILGQRLRGQRVNNTTLQFCEE